MGNDLQPDVFVLGAGFSKAASDSMPLVKELGRRLSAERPERWQELERKHAETLSRGKAVLDSDVEAWLDYLATETALPEWTGQPAQPSAVW